MIYARAHDQTVEADYFQAMERVEQRLDLAGAPKKESQPVTAYERGQILALAEQLAEPELSFEVRLDLVTQIRCLLNGQKFTQVELQTVGCKRAEWIPPPHRPARVDAETL